MEKVIVLHISIKALNFMYKTFIILGVCVHNYTFANGNFDLYYYTNDIV